METNPNNLILLDIFSYSCMNCLRSLVYIKKIDNKYKQYGLETIIIHPPEWEFEKNVNNIIYALKRYNIKIPLIIDKNKKIIKRLKINFWPTQILIKNRKILYKHIGEGDYKNLENKIIKILKIKTKKLFNKEPRYSKFPAIYLGKRKKAKITRLKSKLKFGIIHTKGNWLQKDEFLCSIGKEESSLLILTKGKITNFVVRSINKKIINVKVNLNEKYVKNLTINIPRLYNIIETKDNRYNQLTLTTKKGLAIYSFSFQ